jgi:hypothetical protein
VDVAEDFPLAADYVFHNYKSLQDGLLPEQFDYVIRTDKASLFVPRSNHDWIKDRSIIALRGFTAKYIDIAKAFRKSGGIPTCTHYIETADLSVNLNGHLKLPHEVIAFAAYAHDLIEDFGKSFPEISPSYIVDSCWQGDPSHKALLVKSIGLLTDDPALKGRARHEEQIRIANHEDESGLVAHVRFCDKLSTLIRDYNTLLTGEMPLGSKARFQDYYKIRHQVVSEMKINPRLKRWYNRLVSKVEKSLERDNSRGRNDFLDPINFVLRSPSDNLKVTRKMIADLAPAP